MGHKVTIVILFLISGNLSIASELQSKIAPNEHDAPYYRTRHFKPIELEPTNSPAVQNLIMHLEHKNLLLKQKIVELEKMLAVNKSESSCLE